MWNTKPSSRACRLMVSADMGPHTAGDDEPSLACWVVGFGVMNVLLSRDGSQDAA